MRPQKGPKLVKKSEMSLQGEDKSSWFNIASESHYKNQKERAIAKGAGKVTDGDRDKQIEMLR